ncbi:MAG TPA: folylpolyglutamate synthase/dihydrofolate synthase family protein [Pyrinomonadaceae bacterium]|nr:folylpolyglutamate synthase/dihydrofolate synthase family protein [Pyrinomonadaceae bacterium]
MDFAASTKYLYSLGNEVSAMKLGLENIRTLIDALGKPHEKYLKVQVAGTNGKGSVCAFLNSICLDAGVKTGLYTSPHLISITERVKINGIDISEDEFARHATLVRETAESLLANGELEYRPTFFEQMTAIALVAFGEAKVELAILETGLGGRLDATTAANAEIAAITRIDLDHQEYLGDTIEEIAAEKAAIIRAGSKVVVGEQSREAIKVVLERCTKFGVEPILTEAHSLPVVLPPLGLNGHHQIENAKAASLVVEILKEYFPITDENKVTGLQNARHPGRLEYQGKYLFDGAHNIGGANALAEYIRGFETRPITLVFGAMNDKNVTEIFATLAPIAERIIVTEPLNSRSLSYQELLEQMPTDMSKERTFATDNVKSAVDIANEVTPDDGIILVTGSIYLVGEVKTILRSQI